MVELGRPAGALDARLHVEHEFVLNATSLGAIVTYCLPDDVLSDAMMLPLPPRLDRRYQLQYPGLEETYVPG